MNVAPVAGEDTGLALPFSDMDETGQLMVEDGRARLIGTVCGACGARSFLARQACYACGAEALSPAPLSPDGRLYSFTTIHVSAHRPTPYMVGYVDLEDGVRVLGGLVGDPSRFSIDARVALTATPDGGWAFELAEG